MLSIRDLHASYGEQPVLSDVCLSVEKGRVASVIGTNGAGKSTLMKCIANVGVNYSGEIWYEGENISRWPAHKRVEAGIVLVPEGRRVFANMTVRENLELGSYPRRARKSRSANLERVYALLPKLKERERQAAGTLSGGEQQMVALGRALMAGPKLLLMDEPTLGLAPLIARWVFSFVKELAQQDITVLLVEQNAMAALNASHWAYILARGTIAADGPAHKLAAQPDLRDVYWGI